MKLSRGCRKATRTEYEVHLAEDTRMLNKKSWGGIFQLLIPAADAASQLNEQEMLGVI